MKQNGPWIIKESTEKYKNRWITVTEHQVIRPDGNDGIFGVVEMLPGVIILPIDTDNNVYLTKEFRFAIGAESIEAANGGIEENQTPIEAAQRELKEELGIIAKEWTHLGKVNPLTSVVSAPMNMFLAQDFSSIGETELEGTEQITTIKVPFQQAVDMVISGEISNGPTCTLLLKANEYLKRNSA